MTSKIKGSMLVLGSGIFTGIIAVLLVYFGNPANMGLCIACFLRDGAGALGFHRAEPVQYMRPEIIGIVLGAFLAAFLKKDLKARGGSAPFARFLTGVFVMIGALVFLGCPLRMVLRLAGGDLGALLGLAGFAAGVFTGSMFLKQGFSFKRNYSLQKNEVFLFPALMVLFLVFLLAKPAFLFFSKTGPGSMHAPILITLAAGLLVGAAAQRSRLCLAGGIRDVAIFRDPHLLYGFVGIFGGALIMNLVFGFFKPGFAGQPVAHTDGLWNFLGMSLVGLGSVFLGGCPLRQLILSAEGNIDSVVTIMGMGAGAAVAHNFGLASSAAGATANGKFAVIFGLVFVFIIGFLNTKKPAV
ncbi:YedE family putative selenium transporter [Spirochaetota bacterium]